METDGRGCIVMMQTRDSKPLTYSNGGQLGQLLSCVAKDPVLSQPCTLPHWQCDSKAHLELQELRLHLMEEALPSCMALFGNSSFPEAPSRLSLVARWSGQGHVLPLH